MPRLIDADALLKRICELCGENCEMPNEAVQCIEWEFAHDAIESLPSVDAVEVVRCKDCKWCHAGYCEKADDIIPFGFAHHEWENFYCAWGERRKNG